MEQEAVIVRHPETGEIVIQRTVLSFESAENLQLESAVANEQKAVDDVQERIDAKLNEIEALKDEKADKERSLEKSKRLFDGYKTLVGEPDDGTVESADGVDGEVAHLNPEPIF